MKSMALDRIGERVVSPRLPGGASWPIASILISCIFLQRLGISFGSNKLPLPALIVVAVFLLLIARNEVLISASSLSRYLLLCTCAVFSTALALAFPPSSTEASIPSVYYLLLLYAFVVLRPRAAIGILPTLRLFRSFVAIVAICGALQFALQFVGIRLFSFEGIVPEALLGEAGSNVVIPIWPGAAVYKANGFFMSEPSSFSQLLALGIVVEFIYFRSTLRMAMLAAALLLAFSGTGLLVLGFAVLLVSLGDRRLLSQLAKFGIVAVVVVVLFSAFASQEYLDAFTRRTTELSGERSSGHLRFVTPYKMLAELASDTRLLVGFGPGTAERFRDFRYGINALTKTLIEYGIVGLLAYVSLLMSVFYRRDMRLLSAVCLFLFVFGGGYLLNPPIVYLLTALLTWGPGEAVGASAEVRNIA
ncbi:MAG TPA: hypothetical protein VJV79_27565 [Polyangiaceae bacterium]|nr:hypothetical protein [Polyangiaceae bacterium]